MKKRAYFRKSLAFFGTILLAACFTACENIDLPDTVIIAKGPCKIHFQPGVKDWNTNPLHEITDNDCIFSAGFGPPIWQGKPAKEVEAYKFLFQSSWLSVRCADPAKDFVNLNDIWIAYSAKSVQSDGSIITTAFGKCVVNYVQTQNRIWTIPGSISGPHIHKFRIIARSKPVNGGKFLDSIQLTVYANDKYPNSNDPEQLIITMTDTDTNDMVFIWRENDKP